MNRCLHEDVGTDLGANRTALKAFDVILNVLKNGKMPTEHDPSFTMRSTKGLYWAVLEISSLLNNSPLEHIVFMPESVGRDKGIRAAYGSYNKTPAIIMFILPDEAVTSEKAWRSVAYAFYKEKKSFVHEFTHYMDELRQTRTKYHKGSERFGDPNETFNSDGYYNSPEEFNAYYHEGLEFIHDSTLALARGKHQAYWFKLYPDFNSFYKSKRQSFDPAFLNSLNKRNLQRLKKRLFNYYTYVSEKWSKYYTSPQANV